MWKNLLELWVQGLGFGVETSIKESLATCFNNCYTKRCSGVDDRRWSHSWKTRFDGTNCRSLSLHVRYLRIGHTEQVVGLLGCESQTSLHQFVKAKQWWDSWDRLYHDEEKVVETQLSFKSTRWQAEMIQKQECAKDGTERAQWVTWLYLQIAFGNLLTFAFYVWSYLQSWFMT